MTNTEKRETCVNDDEFINGRPFHGYDESGLLVGTFHDRQCFDEWVDRLEGRE